MNDLLTLNLHHPFISSAYKNLMNEDPNYPNLTWQDFNALFEDKYKCKIQYKDDLGINGTLKFRNEQALGWFLIQNSENNIEIK